MQPGHGYEFSKSSSNAGDDKARARWDQFEKLNRSQNEYEAARERLVRARSAIRGAECDVSNAARALDRERKKLAELTALSPEDAAHLEAPVGEPVPREP